MPLAIVVKFGGAAKTRRLLGLELNCGLVPVTWGAGSQSLDRAVCLLSEKKMMKGYMLAGEWPGLMREIAPQSIRVGGNDEPLKPAQGLGRRRDIEKNQNLGKSVERR